MKDVLSFDFEYTAKLSRREVLASIEIAQKKKGFRVPAKQEPKSEFNEDDERDIEKLIQSRFGKLEN